jgi:hypothetical protein
MRRASGAEVSFPYDLSNLSQDPVALAAGRACATANLARQELPA